MRISAGQAAFATTVVVGAATITACVLAANTASTVALVAYSVLAVTGAGASIAAITAWIATSGRSGSEFFEAYKDHAGVAIAGFYQFTVQAIVQALIQGLAQGIGTSVRRKIAGPDVTVQRY